MLGVACQAFFGKRRRLTSERRVSFVKWRLKSAPAPNGATVDILWVRQFVAHRSPGERRAVDKWFFVLEPKAKRV
jgi:hypothetical protein